MFASPEPASIFTLPVEYLCRKWQQIKKIGQDSAHAMNSRPETSQPRLHGENCKYPYGC